MGNIHANAGEVVRLSGAGADWGEKSRAIVKATSFEAIRLVVRAGETIPPHKTKGPITVQCLEGRTIFSVGDEEHEMSPGDWLYLDKGQIHALRGVEDSTLLVTIVFV